MKKLKLTAYFVGLITCLFLHKNFGNIQTKLKEFEIMCQNVSYICIFLYSKIC